MAMVNALIAITPAFIAIINLPPERAPSKAPNLFYSPYMVVKNLPSSFTPEILSS